LTTIKVFQKDTILHIFSTFQRNN